MSFNTTPTSSTNNIPYMGIQEQNPRETYIRRRDPSIYDYRGYKIGDRWINKSAAGAFILVSKFSGIATWVGMGGSGGVISINGCNGIISLAGGSAIDVVTACPILTIDARVDNVTIQVNGGNNLEAIPSGILNSLQFDPDVGANVSPVASILQVPGIGGNQTLNGGAGILQLNNRRWLSSFTVDPSAVPGLDAEYTTIQAAINAATGPAVVYIRTGVYIEDLTLKDGVDLIGIQGTGRVPIPGVQVTGSHTYSGATNLLVSNIHFLATAGDTFSITPAAGLLVFGAFNCSLNNSNPGGRSVFLNPGVGAIVVFGSFNNNFSTGGAVLEASGNSQALIFDSQCFNGVGDSFIANDTSTITVDDSEVENSLNAYKITSATASITSTNNRISCDTAVIFTGAGTMNMYHDTVQATSATTQFVQGAGTFNFGDVVNRGSANTIDPVTTQGKQNWQPYGESGVLATAYRGTAAFDNTQFTVTEGFVQFLGGAVTTNIDVDTFTAPGTDPVVPNGGGAIILTGAQVAAGTTANVIRTDSLAANTCTIEVQRSAATGVSTLGSNGVSHFSSSQFTVDANAFVQLAGTGSIIWNLITVNTVGITNNGYIAVSAGGALTVSLPATSAIGDIFEVALDGATSWQITQVAAQQIRLGNVTTTLGAGGSITTTAQGDTIRLVCRSANTLWTSLSSIGNLTVV